ncbi:hypothetical protein [Spiroplasma culicicola]|uniref:Uncharacterized protein n=1 Tax=Spiroplasma culicicola AES-1 TaxID=1276246 RepID=W6A6S0_9MOLU|nr:hypothetical protein [Spiroplasma culicicola]AHI52803.1 hypothetical protein SCULI_v1c04620 [Spiroplasma culicicola AES-1]
MFKLLSLIGALGLSASSGVILTQGVMNNQNYMETDFYWEEGPYGITEDEEIETNLIANFVKELAIFLEENNQELQNITDAKIRLMSTAESTGQTGNIVRMLVDLIENGGEIVSETYQAKHVEAGNYSVKYLLNYVLPDGSERQVNLNTYPTLFNQYQLENGAWRLTLEFEYVEKDINETEDQFISNIELPDFGVHFYTHQIIDMFNNHEPFNNSVKAVIEKQKEVKLKDIHSVNAYKAIKTEDSFAIGDQYDVMDLIEDEYLYISFESNSISGTYNMLIKNVDLK